MILRRISVVAIVVASVCSWALVRADNDKQPASAPAHWQTSVAKACMEANQAGKLVLADFTGSDWCPWCMKLKKEVFDTQEFQDWAAKKFILLELDFPSKIKQDPATKKQNEEMSRKYKVDGFPTIVFLKPDRTKVGQIGYVEGGPKAWIAEAEKQLNPAERPAPKN